MDDQNPVVALCSLGQQQFPQDTEHFIAVVGFIEVRSTARSYRIQSHADIVALSQEQDRYLQLDFATQLHEQLKYRI